MTRKEELKEIIRLNQDPADWGHTQAQFNVIQAEEELAEIEAIQANQQTFNLETEEESCEK